ncbi:MAG: LPD38 domain-containing protein [Comamonas sp.]
MATDLLAAFQAAMGEVRPGAQAKGKESGAPAEQKSSGGIDLFTEIGHAPQPRMERTWGEAAADTAAQLGEGANNIVGAIPSLLAPDSGAARALKDGAEYWRDKQSMPMQRRMAKADKAIAEADPDSIIDQGLAAGKAYLSDPALAARLVATNLPSVVVGAGAAKGAQLVGMAAGATRAAAAAGATTASGVTNAALNAGGARGEAFDTIYKAAKDKGYTDEQARAMALEDSKLPAVVGAVTGFVSGRSGLEKAIVGKGLAQGGVKAAGKALGAELLGEQLEEVAPQMATNIQAENYDGRSFKRDIGRTAVETAIASGPGAVVAGAGAGLNKEEQQAAPALAPALAQQAGTSTGTQAGTSATNVPASAPAPSGGAAAAAGTSTGQAVESAPTQAQVEASKQEEGRSPGQPDGDPLEMDEATANQRMAELEVMDSTTGLNAGQQREKLMLAHRLDELATHADELENIGEEAAPAADALYDQALDAVRKSGRGAISVVQRELRVGYNTAAKLLERMESEGVVGPLDVHGQRAVVGFDEGGYMIDHDEAAPAAAKPPTAAEVKAQTWPQFVHERGLDIGQLRRGTADWNTLQTEWGAVKTHRAGLKQDGNGSTAAPVNEIQNRDRSRPASVMQMQAMAQKPDYMRLGPSRTPESGAPMVFSEGDQLHAAVATGTSDFAVMSDGQRVPFQYAVMEAADVQPSNFADGAINPQFDSKHPGTVKALNNGRTAGLRAAYERGTAESYKQELIGDTGVHGIDPAVIDGMQSPMLVRLYSEKDNRHNMGVKSQSQALGLSAAEQAATDSHLMDAAMLDLFDAGGLDGQGNRDFVRGFVHRLQQAGQDVAEMMDAGGRISPKGVQRLQAAMVHKAFDDGDLVETMFGSQDNDVRAIGEAFKEVAGEWAHMRHMASTGVINAEVDLTPNLLQAIRLVQKARRDRSALSDLVNQVDIETGDVVPDLTMGMLRMLYSGEYMTRARGRDAVTQHLRDYMSAALATSADGSDMFGERVGAAEIVSALTGQNVSADNAASAAGQSEDQQAEKQTDAKKEPNDSQEQQADDGRAKSAGGEPAGGRADAAEQPDNGQGPEAASKPADSGGEGGQDAPAQGKQQDSQGAESDQEDGHSAVEKADPLALQAYTADELRQQEQEQQQAAADKAKEEAEAEKKAKGEREAKEVAQRMDASAENFQLGQDAQDSLAGQGSIFDAPAASKTATSASKTGKSESETGKSATEPATNATQQPSTDELNAMFDELMAEEFGQDQQPAPANDGRPKVGDVVPLGKGRVEAVVKGVREDGTVNLVLGMTGMRSMSLADFKTRQQLAIEADRGEQAAPKTEAEPKPSDGMQRLLELEKKGIAYADLATSQTWTGRGKAPAWIRSQDREQYVVQEQLRRKYFKPGAVIRGYSGFDEVISYQPQTLDKHWSVTVHEVVKRGDEWVRVGKSQDQRTHRTQPEAANIKTGPRDFVKAGEAQYTEPRADGKPMHNAPVRGAGEALASAAGNVAAGLANAIDGLGALFGGAGKLGSGLSFDEQTYAKAKPLFDQALANMKDASKDLREAMRAVIKMVGDKFGADAVRNMQPYVVQYIKDLSAQPQDGRQTEETKEKSNASDPAASVERHSGKPAVVPANAGAIQGNDADTAPAGGQAPGQASGKRGPGQQHDTGLSVDSAALSGKRSDQRLHSGNPAPGLEGSSTGADILEGVPAAGRAGVPLELATADEVASIAGEGSHANRERSDAERAKQLSKDKPKQASEQTVYALGSEEHAQSVRDAIPQLLPGQVDDVVKAEKAYRQPDTHGMLLTNGTGTGKTFSGLGVVRRFVDQGKTNILIPVPDDKIASDWVRSGQLLGLKIHQLESTKDAGKGVTVTTYANLGENKALASRQWDLIVPDEAHSLMSNQDASTTLALEAVRGLTYHPRGVWARMAMVHAEDYAKSNHLKMQLKDAREANKDAVVAKLDDQLKALWSKLEAARKAMEVEFQQAGQEGKRTKMLALSATPFAYDKNIDWAEGYLFSYDEGRADESKQFRGYNEGANKDQFFMQHFGYRMRYNKLTRPEAGVDSNLMERQFNTWLKQRGVLSTRMLEVPADYDRRFVLFESAIGNRIDEALSYLAEKRGEGAGHSALNDLVNKQLDYQTRRYLLEAIKAKESVEIVRKHLALGRKVVVYHDFIKGGGTNPFDIRLSSLELDVGQREELEAALRDFNAQFGDLQRANLHELPSPVRLYKEEFPDLLLVNGKVKPKRSVLQAYTDFNDDSRGPQVMLVQSAKDKGWSGHDTTGKYQRVLINLGLPTAPTKAIQQEGRTYRTGVVTDAIMRYLNTGTSWERTAFASTIATRAATAENLAMGELARSLQDSFVEAFEEADTWEPGHEGEGKGGKERDRASSSVVSEWDRAKTLYWAQQKKTAKTKAKEGADYFATPEPLGMKMVEWGGVVEGEETLEPSAGHGAIARWFPTTSRRTMVEPSPVLRSRLALAGFKDTDRIIAGTFEELDIGNKYDVIAMNPPFGTASRTAVDHMAKAYRHLREGGRMVALLPNGPAADKKLEAWLYERSDKADKDGDFPYTKPELHRAADVLLPGLAFGRAATNVATRIVIIDKLAKDDAPSAAHRMVDLSNAGSIEELFDRLENQPMPKRSKQLAAEAQRRAELKAAAELPVIQRAPEPGQAERQPVAGSAASASEGNMLPRAGRKTVEYFTKKGKRLEGVIFEGSKAEAEQFDPYTMAHEGGWFIRGRHVAEDVERPSFLRNVEADEERMIAFAHQVREGSLDWRKSRARDVVNSMMAKWGNALPVVVASTMQDEAIPKVVRDYDQQLKDQGATGEAAGFIYKGAVYLITNQLPTSAAVVEALAHEMLGHAGLRGVFGKGLLPILRQVADTRPEDMRRIARDYGLSLDSEADRLHVAEEVLAFMAQTQPELGFVRRALAVISAWLRDTVPGLANMRMSDAEMIHKYILPARAYIEKASTEASNDTTADDAAFLRVSPGQAAAVGRKTLGQLQQRVKTFTGYESWDSLIYAWQDRFIDLKRIQQRIKDLNGTVSETNDAYQGEELYHKRVAKRAANFLRDELKPLLTGLNKAGVKLDEFERFLHARHAGEANAVLAERNPNQATIDLERDKADKELKNLRLQLQSATAKGLALAPIQKAMGAALMAKGRWDDAEAFRGTEDERLALSGMTDLEAQNILSGYPAAKRAQLDALANQVDAINEGTLQTLGGYGLMDAQTLDAWRKTYKHYVPLHRDEAHPDSKAHPIGQGFSTRGDAAKQRTGSKEKVTHILSHIAMQREAAITRGEKNNVAKRLYVLAAQNPDANLWSLDLPKKKAIDPDTGLVKTVVDRAAALHDNVLMVRIAGHDKHLVFNPKNEQAARLAIAMRNLDATELDRFTRVMGKLTRWFAAVNTQYNPVFSMFNFARDIQGAMLQLSTTPLAGQEAQVLKNVGANIRSIYKELRNERKGVAMGSGKWAQAWEQMQMDGGMTGFRELYADPKDRAEALQKALAAESHGRVRRSASAMFGWLSDFNETAEGTTRLAVYQIAIDKGMTRQQAASIAKNITVNFNRRGRNTSVVGSYYAFMNAAIQGNVRMYETLSGPRGRQIMLGGVLLGMTSALLGHFVMGGDGADDEWKKVPEFVKERNIVIPFGPKDYVTIPMPLGFHVFPNIGRKMVEMVVNDDPHKGRISRLGEMALIAVNAYNPLGGAENLMQMVAPTPFDPVAALMENKDWTGKPIYKEQRSSLDPKPGHTMAKDSTSQAARWAAQLANYATGGNDWRPGSWSPNPDAIEYLFGQFTGGVGRELAKGGNVARSMSSGDELAAHQIPVLGRMYGNTRGINGQSESFYSNIQRINVAMNEAKGRSEEGEDPRAVLLDVPLAKLDAGAALVDKRVRELTKMRNAIQKGDNPEKTDLVKEINLEIESTMYRLNAAVAQTIAVSKEERE